MQAQAGPVLCESSGIDWLTLVWNQREPEDVAKECIHEAIEEQRDSGNEVSACQIKSWRGIQTMGIRYVRRADSSMIQLSSTTAQSFGMRMALTSGRATRIDLQSTIKFSSASPSFGYSAIGSTTTISRPSGSRLKRSFRLCTAGSFTGEVGSRTSRQFLRVYDKGVEEETHPPGYRWRAELELKDTKALNCQRELLCVGDLARYSYSRVLSSLLKCGGTWPAFADLIPDVHGGGRPRPISDADRALNYLRKYCRKQARIAATHRGIDAVLDALGLDPKIHSRDPRS